VVAPSDNSIERLSRKSLHPTGEGIVIDIGTGDGHFVYQCARQNPKKFFIGIDANPRALEKISEKIHRKPAKGGAPNVLFIQAAVEDLPSELDGIADELHVHFPWGSLLGAMATGNSAVLKNLRRICSPRAVLEIVIGFDPERDRSELDRLGLQPLTSTYIDTVLADRYMSAGFTITEHGEIPAAEWPTLQTTWAKRLKGGAGRSLVYIIARAVDN
jgi:16S rRNA (adenine(1408)-N(1))-methyltransferase